MRRRSPRVLDTPLPSAAARKRLLAARDHVTEKLLGEASQKPAAATTVLWTSTIRQEADLEKQLAALADADFHSASLDMAGAGGANALVPTNDRFWKTYRQFGQELGNFYGGLPERIRKEIASSDSSAPNRCDRLLRLVDARDAKNVPDDVLSFILPHRAGHAGADPDRPGRVATSRRCRRSIFDQARDRQTEPAGHGRADLL